MNGICVNGAESKSAQLKNGDRFPVGSAALGASPYGALDMAGNVWEMTADWYAERAYDDHAGADPDGPTAGTTRVYRGGSFVNAAFPARSASRSTNTPSIADFTLGVRPARVITE